ncbi:MAG: hypothetical protein CL609_10885 [Anaerolineaceae bacterium]|nr:hypothetical protein [Anaerolineaceae bacterium]
MTSPILTTKLFIPPIRSDLLPRPNLIKKLNSIVNYPLTLISASAGSGKTTILSEWIKYTNHPVAWISLDSEDNDTIQFLLYVIHALKKIKNNFGNKMLGSLQSGQLESLESIAIQLINEMTGFSEHTFLILDDFHLISQTKVHDFLIFIVDHLPPQIHLIVTSRIDPPWPLARYRSRNHLLELRGQDLRFDTQEIKQFLHLSYGLDLSLEDVTALEARTEGWVAGLQLAALSMQGHSDIHDFVKDFTGSHLFVAEYLIEEILQKQSEEIQIFLLKTSILERLEENLCDAVLGSNLSQTYLSLLHRKNAFIIPLDNKGQWFRYHHLFADLLQARLAQTITEQEVSNLHKRASNWYVKNNFPVEAVNHALAAGDLELAAGLVENTARSLIYSGRINVLRDWLEVFPENIIQNRPHLTFFLFWIDMLQGKADFSETAIQEKERLLKSLPPSSENDKLRGELMAVVCRLLALSGRTSQAIHLAQEALAYLHLEDYASRARVNSALAIALDLEGRSDEARPVYEECFSQAAAAGDHLLGVHTMMAKGLVQYRSGYLNQASKTFQAIINIRSQEGANTLLRTGMNPMEKAGEKTIFLPSGQGYIGLAHVLLEQYDLITAKEYLIKGMNLCQQGGLDGIFIGRLQMSRLHQANNDHDKALAEIQFPKDAFARVDDYNVTARLIMLALAKGEISKARQFADSFIKILNGELVDTRLPLIFYEIVAAVVSRVYIALDEVDKAFKLLDRLEASAKSGKRPGRLVEVNLLRALAFQKQAKNNLPQMAVDHIIKALDFAVEENYFLLFLEEGSAVIPLLKAVVTDKNVSAESKELTKQLLQAFSEREPLSMGQFGPTVNGLFEQLTPREMEVLELIATGASNQKIADELVVTVRTVKKHTSNIYGKLGVESRTQAVAYARQNGLLPIN